MSAFLCKYATATTIYFPLISYNSVSFSSTASLTTADSKISKNGAAFTTTSNAIASVGSFGYSITLVTGDLTCARAMIVVHHTAATPTFEDTMILIDTYGNASAQHAFDLSVANQVVIASAGTVTLSANQSVIASAGTVTIGASGLSSGAVAAGAFSAGAFAAGFLSSGGYAAGAISAGAIASAAFSAGGFAAGFLTTGGIATGAFTTNVFVAGFLSAGGIAAGAISAGGIAANAISSGGIVSGAITASGGFPSNFSALTISAVTGLVSISTASLVQCGTVAVGVVTSIWSQAAVQPTGVPAITASILSAFSWMFTLSKNTITQTSALQTVFQTDGSTSIAASTVGDDGITFTRGSFN